MMKTKSKQAAVPVAKGYTRSSSVRTTFEVLASVYPVQFTGVFTDYSTELVSVAPFAPMEDGCLVVMAMDCGRATLAKWEKAKGQCILTFGSGSRCPYRNSDTGDGFHIIGRVVGPDREFPRRDIAA